MSDYVCLCPLTFGEMVVLLPIWVRTSSIVYIALRLCMPHHEVAVAALFRMLLQLFEGTDDRHLTRRVLPYREWRGPEAIAGDGPVGGALDDVLEAAVPQMARGPVNLLVLGEQMLLHRLDVDKPA